MSYGGFRVLFFCIWCTTPCLVGGKEIARKQKFEYRTFRRFWFCFWTEEASIYLSDWVSSVNFLSPWIFLFISFPYIFFLSFIHSFFFFSFCFSFLFLFDLFFVFSMYPLFDWDVPEKWQCVVFLRAMQPFPVLQPSMKQETLSGGSTMKTGTKLYISNLDYGVSNDDIQVFWRSFLLCFSKYWNRSRFMKILKILSKAIYVYIELRGKITFKSSTWSLWIFYPEFFNLLKNIPTFLICNFIPTFHWNL